MATSLKALKESLPIPSLADWFLSRPDHVQDLYDRHSMTEEGCCLECQIPVTKEAPCMYRQWAEEAQEYLASITLRHKLRNGNGNGNEYV